MAGEAEKDRQVEDLHAVIGVACLKAATSEFSLGVNAAQADGKRRVQALWGLP